MQKPTLCIYGTTRVRRTRECIVHPMGIYATCFWRLIIEVSQVPIDQKQALVNAIKYVCSLTLSCHADTPAWVCGCKITTFFWYIQINLHFWCRFICVKADLVCNFHSHSHFVTILNVTDGWGFGLRYSLQLQSSEPNHSIYKILLLLYVMC